MLRLPIILGMKNFFNYKDYHLIRYIQVREEKNLQKRLRFHQSSIHMPTDLESEFIGKTTEYEPSPLAHVNALLLDIPLKYEEFSFIDIGSGEARLLCLLSDSFPFKQIIGIELSQSLHKIAQQNIQNYSHKSKDIVLACEDATQYHFPPSPLLLYLCNPFSDDLLERFLINVQNTLKAEPHKPILIIYNNPEHKEVFKQFTCFESVELLGWNPAVWSLWKSAGLSM